MLVETKTIIKCRFCRNRATQIWKSKEVELALCDFHSTLAKKSGAKFVRRIDDEA